jgi:hypothetical protein
MSEYEPSPENAEDYDAALTAYAEEEKIWQEKFPGANMQGDSFEIGIRLNCLIAFLNNTDVLDTDILNIMVLREALKVKQQARARVEEQIVKSRVQIVPGHIADRFKRKS